MPGWRPGGLDSADPPAPTTTALAAGTAAWRIPIHTLDADPVGGEYGWWAVGADYKVSFHDGFVFYPYLGPDYPENLPLRWTTESITVGGLPVADVGQRAEHSHTDWRYEYRWPNVTEAYDVREDGVEQLLVIRSLPTREGDLVVEGRLETKMHPGAWPESAHAEVAFQDDRGRSLVRYGAAKALDALGRELPIETAFDGEHVRLVVPGLWLRDAALPVTIDPLTARVPIATGAGPVQFTAIGRDDESPDRNVLVAHVRRFVQNDDDLYAQSTDDGLLTGKFYVLNDVSANWASRQPDIAFVGDADRWLVAYDRTFPGNLSRTRVYLHDRTSTTPNSGVTLTIEPPSSTEWRNWYPAIGGSVRGHGRDALLVYHSGDAPNYTSSLWGQMIDAGTAALGPRARINPATIDGAYADVSSGPGAGETSWLVAYEGRERADPNDDFDIYLTRLDRSTLGVGFSFLATDIGVTEHKWYPAIDGRNGRYLLAITRNSSIAPFLTRNGNYVITHRIDWPQSALSPTVHGARVHPAGGIVSNLSLAYDDTSRSHWCLVLEDLIRIGSTPRVGAIWRLGSGGNPTEQHAILPIQNSRMGMPSVAYRARARDFQVIEGLDDVVYYQRFIYPEDAIDVPYGQGCGSGAIAALPPYAGSEFFEIRFSSNPRGKNCILLLSPAPAAVPLGPLGMPGCLLNVSPSLMVSVPMASNKGGAAQFGLSLPDAPLVQGDLFAQWVWAEPALNQLGFGATGGLSIQVR